MSGDEKRTRFSAVVEELTAPIKPVSKPRAGGEAKPVVAQLFENVVKVDQNGKPSPCPKCGTSAFEPIWVTETFGNTISTEPKPDLVPKLLCRACPLPSSILAVESAGDVPAVVRTNRYRCSCRARSMVTLSINEVNLYCGKCGRLAIHDMEIAQPKLGGSVDKSTKLSSYVIANTVPGPAGKYLAMGVVTPEETMELFKSAPLTVDNAAPGSDVSAQLTAEYNPACAACGHGKLQHTPTCQWDPATCECKVFVVDSFARGGESDTELRDRINAYFEMNKRPPSDITALMDTNRAPLSEATFKQATEKLRARTTDWYDPLSAPPGIGTFIDTMTSKLASAFGMSVGQLASTRSLRYGPADVIDLAEQFREKLMLQPFDKFAKDKSYENAVRGDLRPRDWDRRTGRTLRGLVFALAEVVLKRAGILFIRASNSAQDKMLIADAWALYAQLGFKTTEPLHTVRPVPRPWPSEVEQPDVVVFTDHYYNELRSETRMRGGRFRDD